MERIRPLGDFVLIEPEDDTGGVSPGGIVIPEGVGGLGDLTRGKVVARGPMHPKTQEEMIIDVSVGDEVLFSKHAGLKLKRDGETMILVMIGQIVAAVMEEAPPCEGPIPAQINADNMPTMGTVETPMMDLVSGDVKP